MNSRIPYFIFAVCLISIPVFSQGDSLTQKLKKNLAANTHQIDSAEQTEDGKYIHDELDNGIKIGDTIYMSARQSEAMQKALEQEYIIAKQEALLQVHIAKITQDWLNTNRDIIQMAITLNNNLKKANRRAFIDNFPENDGPPSFDFLNYCNDCHPELLRTYRKECNEYKEEYFQVYLKDFVQTIKMLLEVLRTNAELYSLASSMDISLPDEHKFYDTYFKVMNEDPSGKQLMDNFPELFQPTEDDAMKKVEGFMRAMIDITDKHLMKTYFKDYKNCFPLISIYLSLERDYAVLTGSCNEEDGDYSLQVLSQPLAKITDEYEWRLNQGDLQQLGNVAMIIGIARDAAALGATYLDFDELLNTVEKHAYLKINIDGQLKLQNDKSNSSKGYLIAHVKGEGYLGFQCDSVRCLYFIPIDITNTDIIKLSQPDLPKKGIKMQVVDGEVIGDFNSHLVTPLNYEIAPKLSMNFCQTDQAKSYLLFNSIGPTGTETWTSPQQNIQETETINNAFIAAFKADNFKDKGAMKEKVVAQKDSANKLLSEKGKLQQAAADLKAGKITYQQFQQIEQAFMARATNLNAGGTNSIATEIRGFSLDLDWNPQQGTYVNQRIDAKQVNLGHDELIYGYINITILKGRKGN